MKRPSMQYYPADKQANVNLRRCTWEERGVWWYLLDYFHDSDEYGILRWTLEEIANALGCSISILMSLIDKGVLKGADSKKEKVSFSPSIAKKNSIPIVVNLIDDHGPLWYSSRMVRDEYIRNRRGLHGVKSLNNMNVPRKKEEIEKVSLSIKEKVSFSPSPSTSSSTSLLKENVTNVTEKKSRKRPKTDLPPDLTLNDNHREIAKGYGLDVVIEFEQFKARNLATGTQYSNWDAAFRNWLHNAHKFKTQNANGSKNHARQQHPATTLYQKLSADLAAAEAAEAAIEGDYAVVSETSGALPSQVDE